MAAAASDADVWNGLWLQGLRSAGLLQDEDDAPELRERPEFHSELAYVAAATLGSDAGFMARAAVKDLAQARGTVAEQRESTGY